MTLRELYNDNNYVMYKESAHRGYVVDAPSFVSTRYCRRFY